MASKGKAIGIVAWSLVVILLVGAGALAFLNQQQSGRAAGLRDALVQVGTAAGVAGIAPEALKSGVALPDVVQQVQAAIQGKQQELASVQGSLSAAQTEAANAKTEVAKLTQDAQAQALKAEALAKDLAAKEEALTEAKLVAEQAGLEAKDVQAAADKQKAELEETIGSLKAQVESAQAELEAARQQAQEFAAAAEAAAEAEMAPGTGTDAAGEAAVADHMEAVPEEGAGEEMAEEAAVVEPVIEEAEGRVIGESKMFSVIRYLEEDQALYLRLLDGQTLKYKGVPLDVADRLTTAGDTLDMTYRFKIQGVYKSIPPDSVVLRKFWKWQRLNPAGGEVRLIEPEAKPVVEPEAVVETAPAEEQVEEAAAPAEPVVEEAVAPAQEEAAPAEEPVAAEPVPEAAPAEAVAVEAVPAGE